MNSAKLNILSTAVIIAMMTACGGGSSGTSVTPPSSNTTDSGDTGSTEGDTNDPSVGISGSGKPVAKGTVDGFGSIFVNGVEFDTDNATIIIDGEEATEADLGVGMVVLVKGTVNDDGITGIAETVIFDDEIEGPISAIELNANGDAMLVTILGVEVIIERTGTVFEDTSFDTLSIGDVIEISGFPESSEKLRATRVEKKSTYDPGNTTVELKGTVTDLADNTFQMGGYTVDFAGAELINVSNGTLADGDYVEVYGTLDDQVITASRIEIEDSADGELQEAEDFSVQGAVSAFVDISNFTVNGIQVDASMAEIKPTGLTLANGVYVEVEGLWDGTLLSAKEVEGRRGDIEIEADVIAVDTEANSITLGLFGGSIAITTDARTLFDDDTGATSRFTLADVFPGDFLEIEAVNTDAGLTATRIDRDQRDDEKLQAPVESFSEGATITLLGITFSVDGSEFEGKSGQNVSSDVFSASCS